MIQLVDEKFACPNCGEQEVDKLAMYETEDEDGKVYCTTCKHHYDIDLLYVE